MASTGQRPADIGGVTDRGEKRFSSLFFRVF
jgi:hypothetical protein